jgi:hypothetical protein
LYRIVNNLDLFNPIVLSLFGGTIVLFWMIHFKYKQFYELIQYEDLENGESIEHEPPRIVTKEANYIKPPVPIIRESKNEAVKKIIRTHNLLVKIYWLFFISLIFTVLFSII